VSSPLAWFSRSAFCFSKHRGRAFWRSGSYGKFLFLGQMTPAAALAAAGDPNPDTKKSHVCEAHFYSGELALRRDAKEEAVQLFKAAAESCPKTFIGDVAVAELKRLAQ
jgi:hypothetical protein